MSHEISDRTSPPFQRGFHYVFNILFSDSNIVGLQLNLRNSRYRQGEWSWANMEMKTGHD